MIDIGGWAITAPGLIAAPADRIRADRLLQLHNLQQRREPTGDRSIGIDGADRPDRGTA
jgi:hypothetical protein